MIGSSVVNVGAYADDMAKGHLRFMAIGGITIFARIAERICEDEMRTINGEVLIDNNGDFNEQAWIKNIVAVGELLAELYSDKGGVSNEQMDKR